MTIALAILLGIVIERRFSLTERFEGNVYGRVIRIQSNKKAPRETRKEKEDPR